MAFAFKISIITKTGLSVVVKVTGTSLYKNVIKEPIVFACVVEVYLGNHSNVNNKLTVAP